MPAITRTITLQISYNPETRNALEHWPWDEIISGHGIHFARLYFGPTGNNLEIINAELTARELSDLLFPDFGPTPLSQHPRDNPVYRVRVLSYELGMRIAGLDPGREFFHFEFMPNTLPPRVELWSQRAWRDSLSRQLRIGKHNREHDPEVKFLDRYNRLLDELSLYLKRLSHQVSLAKARESAEGFIKSPSYDDLLPILQVPADMQKEIREVRQLFAELSANPQPIPTQPLLEP